MIVSHLKSRLGNQMFQYATGRALAERHGTEVVLDTTWLVQYNRGGGNARYWLDPFELGVRVCPVWEAARVPNPRPLVHALQRVRPSRRRFVRIIEEQGSMAFEPRVLTAPDDTYLIGYWQFPQYFEDHEAVIRDAFTFPAPAADGEDVADRIRAVARSVSVHVRRGDYTGWEMMGFLDLDWYRRAVDEVAERAGGEIEAFVFSDDPAWCREHLRLGHKTTVVDLELPDERAWEDMYLLSLCRHHVISNSTFSWWGAWLSDADGKLVVGPRTWSLEPHREGSPMLPGWTAL